MLDVQTKELTEKTISDPLVDRIGDLEQESARQTQILSVGLGTTLRCNLKCPHCYSRGLDNNDLQLADLEPLLKLPVSSLNFGTGENGLNPHFGSILDHTLKAGIDTSLTSNGYTVTRLTDHQLMALHDLDISLDFASKEKFDAFRGDGAWDLAMSALERSKSLGVETSIVMCLMSINAHQIVPILQVCKSFEVALRINVYKAVHSTKLCLEYDQFWDAVKTLFDHAALVSCSEPIVNAMLNIPHCHGSPCGKTSVRIRPDKSVIPCVYWPNSDVTLDEFYADPGVIRTSQEFQSISHLPEACQLCEHQSVCGGGCAARRKLEGGLMSPDRYCPSLRHERVELSYQWSTDRQSQDYVHSSYLCTMIVKPV